MMEHNNIDKLFQKKIDALEVNLPSEIWSAIEASLRKRKKMRFWLFFGGSLITLLLLSILLFNFSEKQLPENTQENNPIVKESTKKQEQEKTIGDIQSKGKTEKNNADSIKIVNNKKQPFTINVKSKQPLVKTDKNFGKNNINSKSKNLENNIERKSKKERNQIADKETMNQERIVKKDSLNPIVNSDVVDEKEKKKIKKEVVAAKKEKIKPVKKANNWEIYPVIGVLHSGKFSNNASIIDTRFNENTLSTAITFSYGFSSVHKLDEKWSIRWGIHLQELSYTTKDVFLTNLVSGNNLSNVTYNPGILVRFISSKDNIPSGSEVQNAILKQTYGYVELPLEVRYNIYKTPKFSTNIVTGFSSLFLSKNEVSAESELFSKKVGSMNNLKSISFTANFGLDIDYAFTKKWVFNISPMFKKQLNTFSGNTSGFNPYYIGIYSGIKYQF